MVTSKNYLLAILEGCLRETRWSRLTKTEDRNDGSCDLTTTAGLKKDIILSSGEHLRQDYTEQLQYKKFFLIIEDAK